MGPLVIPKSRMTMTWYWNAWWLGDPPILGELQVMFLSCFSSFPLKNLWFSTARFACLLAKCLSFVQQNTVIEWMRMRLTVVWFPSVVPCRQIRSNKAVFSSVMNHDQHLQKVLTWNLGRVPWNQDTACFSPDGSVMIPVPSPTVTYCLRICKNRQIDRLIWLQIARRLQYPYTLHYITLHLHCIAVRYGT